ncbi:MAG: hypothetical protein ABI300_10135 [Rhodanobacter sp.]
MHYDQSWMGFGVVGALQAAAVSVAVAMLASFAFHGIGRRHGWGLGPPLAWSFLLALGLTASGDLADLFYFNFGRLQSLALLKAKLALVHDPDSIGMRALFEVAGVAVGVYLGWLVFHHWRRRSGPRG